MKIRSIALTSVLASSVWLIGCAGAQTSDEPSQGEVIMQRLANLEARLDEVSANLGKAQMSNNEDVRKLRDEYVIEMGNVKDAIDTLTRQVAELNPASAGLNMSEDRLVAEEKCREEIAKLREHGDWTLTLQNLRDIAPVAARHLTRELSDEKNLAMAKFRMNIVEILSRMPSEAVADNVSPLLSQSGSRIEAAKILGAVGGPNTRKALRAYANSGDQGFRFQVGVSLVKLKDESGVPILLDALSDGDQAVNLIAIKTLEQAFGVTHGYKAWAPDAEKQVAIKSWRQFWEKFQGSGILDKSEDDGSKE